MIFSCKKCARTYKSEESLIEHWRGSPKHPNCKKCGRGSKNEVTLREHYTVKHPKVACTHLGCSNSRTYYADELLVHYQESALHTACPQCGVGVFDKETLDQHITNSHSILPLASPSPAVNLPSASKMDSVPSQHVDVLLIQPRKLKSTFCHGSPSQESVESLMIYSTMQNALSVDLHVRAQVQEWSEKSRKMVDDLVGPSLNPHQSFVFHPFLDTEKTEGDMTKIRCISCGRGPATYILAASSCGHIFCASCIQQFSTKCPYCWKPFERVIPLKFNY